MFASADCSNNYLEQTVYDSEWTENATTAITTTGTSWLNLLTSQPIPEETDSFDGPCTSVRSHTPSSCSSSSVESCYVVLEIQRQRSIDEAPSKTEDTAEVADEYDDEDEEINQEDEEEIEEINQEDEEEIEEEIEELNFAQTIHNDNHKVDYEQIALPMAIETPTAEHVDCQHERCIAIEEYAEATQPIIQETPNDILFSKAKALSKFTKRIKAISYATMKEKSYTVSSDDESLNVTKLKTITRINEYYPTLVSSVAAEQQSSIQNSDSFCNSTTSLDSIENKSSMSSPVQHRITTTFSNLSSQRTINPTQCQRSGPAMGTTTLKRTFAFDRACMEKYGRVQGQSSEPLDIEPILTNENMLKKEIDLSQKQDQKMQQLTQPDTSLHYRSFINKIPTSIYVGSEASTVDDSEYENHSSKPSVPPMQNNLPKAPSILGLMKKCARAVKTEYRLAYKTNDNPPSEPTLLEVKYLDGRLPLQDDEARESLKRAPKLSSSICSRINRLGLHKGASNQDLASTTSSFYTSYRKRMMNRFRSFVENNLNEPPIPSSTLPQSRSWQHRSITELFHERKYKVNHQQ